MAKTTSSKELPSYEYPKQTIEKREKFESICWLSWNLMLTIKTVEWADLEALDISKLEQPGGKEALATQVLNFIDKNGRISTCMSYR